MASVVAGERKRRYTGDEIKDIIREEKVGPGDLSFLCALSTFGMVVDNPNTGEGTLAGMKTISIPVIETDAYPTGYFFEVGSDPIIVLNDEASVLDYDFISDLHPAHDWEIYLWMTCPWDSSEESFGLFGEWYQRDVYKDGIMPFDGKALGWEDSAPTKDEEN